MKKSCNYYCFWHKGRKLKKNELLNVYAFAFVQNIIGSWWAIEPCYSILKRGLQNAHLYVLLSSQCKIWGEGLWKGSKFQNFDAFLAHLTQRVRWAIVTTERPSSVVRPSVNFSHFNQLLWSHWANLNHTLVEWSLDGPLPNLCPVIPTSNQDGRQAKNRKKGDEILIVHCCFSISQNELKC